MDRNFKRKANVINEYVIIITVISLAFLTMNTYVKRSIQGKTKDLTDAVITSNHLNQINESRSIVVRETDSYLENSENLEGNKSLDRNDTAHVEMLAKTFDPNKQITPEGESWEGVFSPIVHHPQIDQTVEVPQTPELPQGFSE